MPSSTAFYFVDAAGVATATFDDAQTSAKSPLRPRVSGVADLLCIKGDSARGKLSRAIQRAIDENTRSVIMVGEEFEPRRMVTVRGAREDGRAVVTCVELDAGVSQLQVGDVVELFSLSPAEAEIAILLTRGSSLADVAQHRGVQQETVRGQVKALLRKVGVANQKQLAAVMAQVGAALLDVPAGLAAVSA
ncbi:helix-turn-helix transcriptional regulator [Caulobacter sp. KR2-114]|uniref:helix-turn-helix transcriptional regulator n=1 Tax=Caulobacter sp. KR2-114 TaxID=3400912 RepID=UPI003C0BAAF9